MNKDPIKGLEVAADPVAVGEAQEKKRKLHPYHKCRFIVTAGTELVADKRDDTAWDNTGMFADGDGSIIAKLTDCEQQAQYAALFAAAPKLLKALRLLNAHYDDIRKSNPGFMGKLCLQDYGLWNESLLVSEEALRATQDIQL